MVWSGPTAVQMGLRKDDGPLRLLVFKLRVEKISMDAGHMYFTICALSKMLKT